MNEKDIMIVTTEEIPGREVSEVLGLVRGNTIRARHIGRDIGAAFKGLVGGEIKGYVSAFSFAREEAVSRMQAEAKELGADAIIAVRFTTSQVMDNAAEIMVYGTAVKLQ